MPPPKKRLRPENVQLAAAFAEPVYERLQSRDAGTERHLLAFVHTLPTRLERLLRSEGAEPSNTFQASCYSSIWELPESWGSRPPADFIALDQAIATELRIQDGKYSSAAGYWFMEPRQAARNTSPLLQQCCDSELRR